MSDKEWLEERDEKGWWSYSSEYIPPHPLCCSTCKKNLIILDEIANLAHGYIELNGQLAAIGSTLLSILDKKR